MDREQLEAYESAPKYIVTACHSRVCDGMDKKAQQISDLVQGDILRIATATDKKGREIPLKKMKGNAKVLLPDGRYVIAFRDQAVGSPTRGQFMAWVGT